jgi:hypothetical protein
LLELWQALPDVAFGSVQVPEELEGSVVHGTVLATSYINRATRRLDVRFSAQAQQEHRPQEHAGLRRIDGEAGAPQEAAKQHGIRCQVGIAGRLGRAVPSAVGMGGHLVTKS